MNKVFRNPSVVHMAHLAELDTYGHHPMSVADLMEEFEPFKLPDDEDDGLVCL